LAELADLEAVNELLGWDQETMMPPGGVRARAEQLATLERLFHERLTAAEVEDWLQTDPGCPSRGGQRVLQNPSSSTARK